MIQGVTALGGQGRSAFIRSEGDKLKAIDRELREIAVSLAGLREKIERR